MELDRQLHLADVDKELHDACSTVGDTIEVTSLHSYPTRMWRKDAQASVAVCNSIHAAASVFHVKDAVQHKVSGVLGSLRQGTEANAFI